ncbi:MAG: D-alanyl-D-alanine carboxypeptidase, partial [Clostridia bacterium]|nr:D-alanyl-D-alanine carboxypeptidase [Clostridia bacterium]
MNHITRRAAVKLRAALLLVIMTACAIFSPMQALAISSPGAIAGTSAIVADAETGRVLYESNADAAVEPASTTKVMTVLLVFEAIARGEITLDDEVTARQEFIDGVMYDSSRVLPYIADGEVMTVREYIYCILLMSDCVACDILGDYVCGGSLPAFIERMNTRAAELGCTNTNFVNTHGYPAENHYTTARSLCLILKEAVKYPEFCEIFGTIKTVIEPTNKAAERKLYNSDWMLWDPEQITSIYCRYYYPFATGGKTGSSKKTGHCLVSTAEKDGKELLCVITGTEGGLDANGSWTNRSFSETTRLCEWAFANHSLIKVVSGGDMITNQPLEDGVAAEVALTASGDISLLLPNDYDPALVAKDIALRADTAAAPVSAGDVMGELRVSYAGGGVKTVSLAAAQDVERRSTMLDALVKPEKHASGILIALLALVVVTAGVMLFLINY